jgi:hypothetical protein
MYENKISFPRWLFGRGRFERIARQSRNLRRGCPYVSLGLNASGAGCALRPGYKHDAIP